MKIAKVEIMEKDEMLKLVKDTYDMVVGLQCVLEEYGFMDEKRWNEFQRFAEKLRSTQEEIDNFL